MGGQRGKVVKGKITSTLLNGYDVEIKSNGSLLNFHKEATRFCDGNFNYT